MSAPDDTGAPGSQPPADEFYVGYLDPAPPRLGAWLRGLAAVSLIGGIGLAVAVAAGQQPLPESAFDFGDAREVRGFLTFDPYPSLTTVENGVHTKHLLVGPGKRGAGAITRSVQDSWATLRGTRIHRGDQTMLEVVPGSVSSAASQPAPPPEQAIQDLGIRYVEGEIVGSKCYLGVMNPGEGVAHRACATLCLRGGVPPMLAVTHVDGNSGGMLLVRPDGTPFGDALLDLAARAVGVTGRVIQVGSTTYLHADPVNIRRLD